MTLAERVAELNHLIEVGKTIVAMNRFYADEVVMQGNNETPRVSKVVCMAHEQQNLAKIQSVTAVLLNQAIDAERQIVFSEWQFTFTNLQSQRFVLEEVSVQRWQNGYVVHERFYYSTIISVD